MHSAKENTHPYRVQPRLFRRLPGATLLLALILLLAACSSATSTTTPTPTPSVGQLQFTTINLKLPAAAYNAPTVGPLPGTTVLQLGVSFKVNPKALPGGGTTTHTGQNTDLSKYANQYGITDATYQKIEKYLGVEGVTLNLGKLHSYMTVKAQASTVARLFQTQFVEHRANNRTYYIPTTAPKLPTFVMAYVLAITGLESYSTIAPAMGYQSSFHQQSQSPLTAPFGPANKQQANADCNPGGGVYPQSIAGAYGFTPFYKKGYTAQHMTVNLIELGGLVPEDVQNYFSCVNFPSSQLKLVDVDNPPTQASDEATLDVEMIAGLVNGATIVDYESDDSAAQTLDSLFVILNDELQAIVNDNADTNVNGSVVSVSYGWAEDQIDPNVLAAIDQSLQTLVSVEHMTVFVASGDCGAFVGGDPTHLDVSFPASDPWATAVGGTELAVTRQDSRADEVVWGEHPPQTTCKNSWGGGGGVSTIFKIPSYQVGAGVRNRYSTGGRQLPDISGIAYDLPIYFNGQWIPVNGTSAATPIWSSAMVLLNEALIQNEQAYLSGSDVFYALANGDIRLQPYFDVIKGNNQYYSATPAWDDASGWGSPNLLELYNAALHVYFHA